MAVSTGEAFAHTPRLVKTWDLGAATPQGTLVIQNDVVGVTLTDTEGVAKPDVTIYGSVEITGLTKPGASNYKATSVSPTGFAAGVAIDGTWDFEDIDGATVNTAQGTPVFVDGAGDLTLTAASNTRVGIVNYSGSYSKEAGKLPIAIGL